MVILRPSPVLYCESVSIVKFSYKVDEMVLKCRSEITVEKPETYFQSSPVNDGKKRSGSLDWKRQRQRQNFKVKTFPMNILAQAPQREGDYLPQASVITCWPTTAKRDATEWQMLVYTDSRRCGGRTSFVRRLLLKSP